jgi:hypothetical protein
MAERTRPAPWQVVQVEALAPFRAGPSQVSQAAVVGTPISTSEPL